MRDSSRRVILGQWAMGTGAEEQREKINSFAVKFLTPVRAQRVTRYLLPVTQNESHVTRYPSYFLTQKEAEEQIEFKCKLAQV